MPVGSESFSTLTKLIERNDRRLALIIKNMSGINDVSGRLCRMSNKGDQLDSGEGYILEDGEVLIFTPDDGDLVKGPWYFRPVSGTITICWIEEFSKGWW